MNNKYELIKFEDGEFSLDVNVSPNEDTVWLTKDDISLLFSRDRTVISRHIKNIYNEKELNEETSCAKIAHQIGGQIHYTTFFNLDVNVSPDEDTVWLSQSDMAQLFSVYISRISRHITNIFDEMELEEKSNLQKTQIPFSNKPIAIYDLNMILSIGYRVKSSRGNQFRRWANKILK